MRPAFPLALALLVCSFAALITRCSGFETRPRFLILPGFGNDAVDYCNPLKRGVEFSFVNFLTLRGYEVDVVPIQRLQWLNILRAIVSKDFWTSTCKPEFLFDFYFRAVDESVRNLNAKSVEPIILIGHSAGGWLARGILGDGEWAGSGTPSCDLVAGLVTLGAPHLPPAEGAADMTRGALRSVDFMFPGAHLCSDTKRRIFYITVAGTAVTGNRLAVEGSIEKFASNSYEQVTGVSSELGEIVGDGVVPTSHAHLIGAEQITLPNCFHSIQSDKWYGGDCFIDSWLPQAIAAYERTMKLRVERTNFES